MDEKNLTWKEESRKKVFDCRIFLIHENLCRSTHNEVRTYTVMDAPDWAIVVPVLETQEGEKFVMVRQWRHGSRSLSLEFPGGVFEPGENPQEAAARELQEETGFTPGTIVKMGEFSPNPAIMANKVHFFLACDLCDTGKQELDSDEFVEVELAGVEEVFKGMGKPPFIHALMGSALALYLQHKHL
jgi:8-oxo-dGTP pyrophosphatase MutT (NUDIX family)